MENEQMNPIASRTYRACEGDKERYWETRKATGVVLKDGSFLQTYPRNQIFYSLTAWKNHCTTTIANCVFHGWEEFDYSISLKYRIDHPAYDRKLDRIRSKLEGYYRVIQQRPTAEAPAPAPPSGSEPTARPTLRTREQTARITYTVKLKVSNNNIDVNFRHSCATLEESSKCMRNFARAWYLLHNKEDTLSNSEVFGISNLEARIKDTLPSKSAIITPSKSPFKMYITPIPLGH